MVLFLLCNSVPAEFSFITMLFVMSGMLFMMYKSMLFSSVLANVERSEMGLCEVVVFV